MDITERRLIAIYVAIAICVGVFSVGTWTFKSYMEARAFNRVTGKSVSTFDAMFIELRQVNRCWA